MTFNFTKKETCFPGNFRNLPEKVMFRAPIANFFLKDSSVIVLQLH